jgi:2-haloacid dehalogenase
MVWLMMFPTDCILLGTCVSYGNYLDAIESRLGERMRAHNVGTKLFGYALIEATEREYTYLSLSGKYVVFMDIFRSIFYRTLWLAGIEEPRKLATDEDLDAIIRSYWDLKPREGLRECFAKLRGAGFTVWALTAGDTTRVAGYFSTAGIDLPADNFVSCDTIGKGKPAPECYKFIMDKFPRENLEAWFAAAHMWDSSAARRNGYVFPGVATSLITADADLTVAAASRPPGRPSGRRSLAWTFLARWMSWRTHCRRWQMPSLLMRPTAKPRSTIESIEIIKMSQQ